MYGFAIALWKCDIKKVDLFLHLMAQPPWDSNLEMAPKKPFYIIHYTYGMDYKLTGVWYCACHGRSANYARLALRHTWVRTGRLETYCL